MTPADHYAEAERLLGEAVGFAHANHAGLTPEQQATAHITGVQLATGLAQVHATLATVNPDNLTTTTTPPVLRCSSCLEPINSPAGKGCSYLRDHNTVT